MKCINHNKFDAVMTCNECGCGLCRECGRLFESPMCEPCAIQFNRTLAKELCLQLIVPAIIFVLVFLWTKDMVRANGARFGWGAMIPSAFMAFWYTGWRFLSNRFPGMFVGNAKGWFIYFAIKGVIAGFVGLIVGPYEIVKAIKAVFDYRQLNQQLKQRNSMPSPDENSEKVKLN